MGLHLRIPGVKELNTKGFSQNFQNVNKVIGIQSPSTFQLIYI